MLWQTTNNIATSSWPIRSIISLARVFKIPSTDVILWRWLPQRQSLSITVLFRDYVHPDDRPQSSTYELLLGSNLSQFSYNLFGNRISKHPDERIYCLLRPQTEMYRVSCEQLRLTDSIFIYTIKTSMAVRTLDLFWQAHLFRNWLVKNACKLSQ